MKPIVLGYWTDWNPDFPPEKIPWRQLTHVCHAFSTVGADGLLEPCRDEATVARLVSLGKRHKVFVLLSLGGGTNSEVLTRTITGKERTEALVDAVVARVKKLGYAGVDVDWEGIPTRTAQENLERLVAALRQRLPRPYLLTQAVGGGKWGNEHVETKNLLPHIDFLNLMTYDFSGPWSAQAGHNAPMGFCKSAIDFWHKKSGWPKERLVLGIPLYGRGFSASTLGEAATGEHPRSYVSLSAVQKLIESGWSVKTDLKESVPWAVKPGGGELVSFEDTASAKEKGAWAREQKLGGVFFWELSGDVPGSAVLRAARAGLVKP
jgi:chitinase